MSAPTWVVLQDVPRQLYSLKGISTIASAIGDPLHTENSKLEPFHLGDTKVKVEISLDSQPPSAVIVRDTQGYSVRVNVRYPRPPPKCCNCGKFGHLMNCCPKPLKRAAGKGMEGGRKAPPKQTLKQAKGKDKVKEILLVPDQSLRPSTSQVQSIDVPTGDNSHSPRANVPDTPPIPEKTLVPVANSSPQEPKLSSQKQQVPPDSATRKSVGHRKNSSQRMIISGGQMPPRISLALNGPFSSPSVVVTHEDSPKLDDPDGSIGFQSSPSAARKARKLKRQLAFSSCQTHSPVVSKIFSSIRGFYTRGGSSRA